MIELLVIGSILGFVTLVLFREFEVAWCRLCFTFWCSLLACLLFDSAQNFAIVFLLANTFYYLCEKVVPR